MVADHKGQGTGSRGKGVDKYDMTDDADELERERGGRLGDRMDMSFEVVMDVPDKAITNESSRVGKYAEKGWEDANRAESSMQLVQGGSADRLRALK